LQHKLLTILTVSTKLTSAKLLHGLSVQFVTTAEQLHST